MNVYALFGIKYGRYKGDKSKEVLIALYEDEEEACAAAEDILNEYDSYAIDKLPVFMRDRMEEK